MSTTDGDALGLVMLAMLAVGAVEGVTPGAVCIGIVVSHAESTATSNAQAANGAIDRDVGWEPAISGS